MKVSIVPAQITTVEDKVAGNLSMQQLIMLMLPLIFGFLTFIVLPPNLKITGYKLGLTFFVFLIFGFLAVRVKGELLVHLLIKRLRYNARPRFYIYKKSTMYLRQSKETNEEDLPVAKKAETTKTTETETPNISIPDRVRLEEIMGDPKAKLRFVKGKNGKLDVVIQEIK